MSSAQAPEQNVLVQGEDIEVTWINELSWNDTLHYLDLNSSYCCTPDGTVSDIVGLTSNRSSWSTFSVLSLDARWTHSDTCLAHNHCKCGIESDCSASCFTSCESLAPSDTGYTADANESDSEGNISEDWYEDDIGTMYDNITDDYKLSLRSKSVPVKAVSARARLSFSPSNNDKKNRSMGSQSVSPHRFNRSCCDQEHSPKLKFREKRTDFLRRSSPSNVSNSMSTYTSNASLTKSPPAEKSRKARSLSPNTHQQAVINRLYNPKKSIDLVTPPKKIYRDCCNRNYEPREKHEFLRARTRSNPAVKKVTNSAERSQSFHSGASITKSPDLNSKRSSSLGASKNYTPTLRTRSLSAGIRATPVHASNRSTGGYGRSYSQGKSPAHSCGASKGHITTSTPKAPARSLDATDSASPILPTKHKTAHQTSQSRTCRACCEHHHHYQRKPVRRDFLKAGSKKPSSIKSPMTSTPGQSNNNLPHHKSNNLTPKINYKSPGNGSKDTQDKHNITKRYAKSNKDMCNNDVPTDYGHVNNCKTRTEFPSYHSPSTSPSNELSSSPPDSNSTAASVCDEVLLEFPTLYYKLDCSGEAADIDLENRKQKTGTIYRILDNGLVVCESHPEITDDLIPQSPSDTGKPYVLYYCFTGMWRKYA